MMASLSQKLNNESIRESLLHDDFRLILADAINQTADGILITDKEGEIKFVNEALENICGYKLPELIEKNPKIFKSGNHDKDFYKKMWDVLLKGEPFRAVVMNRNKSGALFYVDETITPLKDSEGRITHYVSVWKDVTKQKEVEATMLYHAFHDPVTGLPNRLLLKDRLEQAISIAKRNMGHIGVIFVDLDKFKWVNDTYGHSIGDKLLYEVGQRIQNAIRETDTVSRLGGDEFVVLLNQIDTDVDAIKIAGIILQKLRENFVLDDKDINISASMGIAVYPQNGLNSEALLKSADTALYQAKKRGRNGYQLFIGE